MPALPGQFRLRVRRGAPRGTAERDTGLLGPDPAPGRLAAQVHTAWFAFASTGGPGLGRVRHATTRGGDLRQ
jgi:hypothetical protein